MVWLYQYMWPSPVRQTIAGFQVTPPYSVLCEVSWNHRWFRTDTGHAVKECHAHCRDIPKGSVNSIEISVTINYRYNRYKSLWNFWSKYGLERPILSSLNQSSTLNRLCGCWLWAAAGYCWSSKWHCSGSATMQTFNRNMPVSRSQMYLQ